MSDYSEEYTVAIPYWYVEDITTRHLPHGKGRGAMTTPVDGGTSLILYAEQPLADEAIRKSNVFFLETVKIGSLAELVGLLEQLQKGGHIHVSFKRPDGVRSNTIAKVLMAAAVALEEEMGNG